MGLLLTQLFIQPLHAKTLKVESIQLSEKSSNLHYSDKVLLPFVSAKLPKIAKKINDYLYIDIAATIAPTKASDGIKRHFSKDDDDPLSGVSTLGYTILLNNGKLFTLQTNGEFCGAYCEEFDNSYSFDVGTGRHITLQDLFTDAGLQALIKKVYAARVLTMQQVVKQRHNQPVKKLVNPKGARDYVEFEPNAEDQILLYETCLAENSEAHKDEIASGDHHELDYFSIDAKGLTFTHARCSNHADRALDQIDQFRNNYTFQSLKPYLTPYAKYLLLGDATKFAQPNAITGQVYYGNIGQAPITFLIKQPEGYDRALRGVYFYNKYRQPIELSGTGNTWTETNSDDKPQPTIKATWQGDALIGQWQGGGRTLPFKMTP